MAHPNPSAASAVAASLAAWALALLLFFAIIGVFGMTAAILTTIGTAAAATFVWLRRTNPETAP